MEATLPRAAQIVLELLECVPAGQVTTYGDLAVLAGCGPRQVGTILARYGSDVPWWRVVRADGRTATHLSGAALARLRAEGVPVRGERVDLAAARWPGPGTGPQGFPAPDPA